MAPIVAFLDRPATPALVVALLAVAAGWVAHVLAGRQAEQPSPASSGDRRPEPISGQLETPAIVALLTNRYGVPASAITATALDLAARGWVRLAVVDDELVVVTRGQGVRDDALRPYEQQVLSHLSSRAFNDVASAGTLALSQHRLDRRWRSRFGHAVADHAAAMGLSERRFTVPTIAPSIGFSVVSAIAMVAAFRGGSEAAVADSLRSRGLGLAVAIATLALMWATFDRATSSDQRPTDLGRQRAAEWLAFRRRLRERIPADATVLCAAQQQAVLAVACVMGVAEQVLDQLPVAPEDARVAWSEAGDHPHLVRVRYPVRPGYGQHPIRVAAVGGVVLVAARWLQLFLRRLSEGDALQSLLERVPGQVDLIESIAAVLAELCWLPLLWAGRSVIAGLVDSVASRVRVGLVVRTRRPSEVLSYANVLNPFADRERFSTYLAVDDGRRASVVAWLATERTSAPQGAQARVRATPLLGYVRASEPVGTATRSD